MSTFITTDIYVSEETKDLTDKFKNLLKDLNEKKWLSGPCVIFSTSKRTNDEIVEIPTSEPREKYTINYRSINIDDFYTSKHAPENLPPQRPFDLRVFTRQEVSFIPYYQKYPEYVKSYKNYCINEAIKKIEQVEDLSKLLFLNCQSLNWEEKHVRDYLERNEFANASITFAIFNEPSIIQHTNLELENCPTEELKAYSCIRIQGGSAPYKVLETELGELIKNHLGESIKEYSSYS